ncbi:MAG: GMC oxidoreductase [Phormidesmis sp.]
MIIDDQHYDIIIIGTGAGGGTLAQKLAPTGKRILILERGDRMPLTEQNRTNVDIFKKDRYHAPEQWYDADGEPFSPQTNYAIGGNTKIYNATLTRFRQQDFESITYEDGPTPEWPIKYTDLEPYYTQAEHLYQVHGDNQQQDPTEPTHSDRYPYPALKHPKIVQPIVQAIQSAGLHPTPLPISRTLQTQDPTGDAEIFGIIPATTHPNVTLKTNANVTALHTNPNGTEIKGVQTELTTETGTTVILFNADIVVLACGAVNTAALLLTSANEKHPDGLANHSGQLGRNLMKMLMTVIVERGAAENDGAFSRSISINDFYWGTKSYPYPMGHIENTGGLFQDIIFAESPPLLSVLARLLPEFSLRQLATRSIGWWAYTGTLPDNNNRIYLKNTPRRKKLYYEFKPNNLEAHDRLVYKWMEVLKELEGSTLGLRQSNVYPRGEAPIQIVGYQCGTCKMGTDPTTSVLNINCRAHDIHNLYIVDSSLFPSCPSIGPALTIMANALRVGEHIASR